MFTKALFGSALDQRADYERRQIPSVVTRCIEEVELRGRLGIFPQYFVTAQIDLF
jgi:hypothetical protein